MRASSLLKMAYINFRGFIEKSAWLRHSNSSDGVIIIVETYDTLK